MSSTPPDHHIEPRLYINNTFTSSQTTRPLFSPLNQTNPLAHIHTANETHIQTAIKSAQKARGWGTHTATKRRDILNTIAQRIEKQKEKFAWIEAKQGGKPIRQARSDVGEVVECFRYFAGK